MHTHCSPSCWGYDRTQGTGYEAIVSFLAFVAGTDHSLPDSTFASGDDDSKTFDFRDPLVQEISIKRDPDFPSCMEAMTGND